MVYYNEFDPKAAAWLRELIRAGLISKGEVDERSIVDVRGSDLAGFERCHFFAGIGGWDYALQLAGWSGPVWTGSCPCQPFSQAGKGKGESDKRHLWPDFRRLIEECKPATVFGEQVASKAGRGWLNGVRTDLEAMDYEVGAADLCSPGVGAPHIRQRLYWVANSQTAERRGPVGAQDGRRRVEKTGRSSSTLRLGDSNDPRSQGRRIDAGEYADQCAAGETSAVVRLGDTGRERDERRRDSGVVAGESGDSETEAHQRERGRDADSNSGAVGGVGYASGQRLAGCSVQLRESEHERAALLNQSQVSGRGASGFWDLFDIVHCTDEKTRRIEPGSFPLAHGIPARMGRLRGYGNAIVPQVAAVFIKAYIKEKGL